MISVNVLTQIYRLLSISFDYPTEEFYQAIKDGVWSQILEKDIGEFTFEFKENLAPDLDYDDFQAEYLNLFEVPYKGNPICPLYEGLCIKNGNRENTIIDLFRFYEYFDVRLNERKTDYPDFLVTELEFMALLLEKEFQLKNNGRSTIPLKRAQLDFLDRHLVHFANTIQQNLERQELKAFEFYVNLTDLLNGLAVSHQSYLLQYLKAHEVLSKEGE